MSATSSSLHHRASLSSREFPSSTELERAINSAGLVEDASPADAFDDDPPLVGSDPAIRRFLAWQWLDDLFHHRRSGQPGAGLGRGSVGAEKCFLLLSHLPLIMVVTTVPIQHTIFFAISRVLQAQQIPKKSNGVAKQGS